MNAIERVSNAYTESDIYNALLDCRAGRYTSVRKCALAYKIPVPSFRNRLTGRISRSHAHEHMQVLSNAEEKTLVRWITHLTITGFPASPSLAIAIAEERRRNCYQVAQLPLSYPRPIGKGWLDRFQARHPDIQVVWILKIDGSRHKATSVETVKTWFDAVTELRLQHKYTPDRIHNMDESGFTVGESLSSSALVNMREKSSWKVISGRQQWITAIECISAGGSALPPLSDIHGKAYQYRLDTGICTTRLAVLDEH
jgi:hypothetical protein